MIKGGTKDVESGVVSGSKVEGSLPGNIIVKETLELDDCQKVD